MQGRLRHVPIPSNIWATPGHYSVIGLLPDDHTYAKGSLFIIKPGTKAVVFDVDGKHARWWCRRSAIVIPIC